MESMEPTPAESQQGRFPPVTGFDGDPALSGDVDLLHRFLATRDEPCPSCGYNLRGFRGTKCPECGDSIRIGLITGTPRLRLQRVVLICLVTFTCLSALGIWSSSRAIVQAIRYWPKTSAKVALRFQVPELVMCLLFFALAGWPLLSLWRSRGTPAYSRAARRGALAVVATPILYLLCLGASQAFEWCFG